MKSARLLLPLALFVWSCGGSGATTSPDTAQPSDVSDVSPSDGKTETVNPPDTTSPDVTSPDTSTPDVTPEPSACTPRAAVEPSVDFFLDISEASGIRVGNYDPAPPIPVTINDHSRLAFIDLNGDRYDDIVMHSLFPNAQAGVPFEHLVFLNQGDGTFIDFSTESGLRDLQSGFFAFGDVDNDGDQDIFSGLDIPLTGYTSQILLNDGTGRFQVLANSGVEGGAPVAANAIFADFNGDAILDLFVGNGQTSYAATDGLYFGLGDGRFSDVSANLVNGPQQSSNGSVACDYDNDGDLDIFVSTYGVSTMLGLNILWENDGGVFTNVAAERGFASLPGGNYFLGSTGYGVDPEPGKVPGNYMGSNGFGIACADVNNDGWLDIFLTTISHPVDSIYSRKWSDPSQLLINQGAFGSPDFKNEFLERGLPFNEGDVDGGIVDFDNDGRLDLSVSRDSKYEKNYPLIDQKSWFGIMWQDADGNFISLGVDSGINDPDVVTTASLTPCSAAAPCTAENEVCLKDKCRNPCSDKSECPNLEICHTGGFCKHLARMRKAQNHAWSDIDLDGDLDLLVGGRDTGGGRPNFLFRNEIGHQNRWLGLRLEGDGVNINRDAIGARVRLIYADRILEREVQSTRGMYNSMDGRILHFGLGDLPCDYTIQVTWPDGTEVSLDPVALGEQAFWTVRYPDVLQYGP